MRTLFVIATAFAALVGGLVTPARAESADAVSKRFAPVVLQRCHGRADYLTRFDYDGNWNGADNWENLDRYPVQAYVYSSAIETRSHWYLTYSFFHPRDWWPVSLPGANHENDMEGVLVVVEKGATPRVLLAETIAHSKILRWSSDALLATEKLDGPLRTEGERPIVVIKAWKHPTEMYTGTAVDRERGVIYRYTGQAGVPAGSNDHAAGYELLPLKDSIWAHRLEVGPQATFADTAPFPNGRYGSSFNGDNYGDNSADAPWNWGYDPDHGLARGEWFFDPAKAMRLHFRRHADHFSTEYLAHPFVAVGPGRRALPRGR